MGPVRGVSTDIRVAAAPSATVLPHLPIDTLKIDHSFAVALAGKRAGAILQTVSALATGLGLELVAGEVETEDHLDRLRGLVPPFRNTVTFAPGSCGRYQAAATHLLD